jgi:hypothetical protein
MLIAGCLGSRQLLRFMGKHFCSGGYRSQKE